MQPIFEKYEPQIEMAKEMTVEAFEAHSRNMIKLFFGASEYVHAMYHDYCDGVPSNMSESEADAFFTENPIQMMVCDEKVQLAFNWASMLIVVPALQAHNELQAVMWTFRTENDLERAN